MPYADEKLNEKKKKNEKMKLLFLIKLRTTSFIIDVYA